MKRIVELMVITYIGSVFYMHLAGGHNQCVIIQERQSFEIPRQPSFLTQPNKAQCQDHNNGGKLLRCGRTDVYVKSECVCTFHNVNEATRYHSYSSCPHGEESDKVTQLTCRDCWRYSLNHTGPCINGGKLTCKGEEVAHGIKCECPPNFTGVFCEEKIEKVFRICDRISNLSIIGLKDCDLTRNDCVTYSKNRRYAYKCNKKISQDRQGQPFCSDTENTANNPSATLDWTYHDVAKIGKSDFAHNSVMGIYASIPLIGLILLTSQI